ncbi:MAG: outer membrane lipoprotein carrier protein LolA [Alphaproteobacteria bacterium]|nr:MAG: outer membrane lipoprotein carrier protein LolA [Alphaproteobacteria bacterium]
MRILRMISGAALALLLLTEATALNASAAAPTAPKLSAEDKAQISRIEKYLDTIRSLRADFLQIDSAGGIAKGKVYLKKPGRMRFEYAPPAKLLVVADGVWLVFRDNELKETTRLPLYSTPVSVLLEDKTDFSEDVRVTKVEHEANVLRLTVIDPDNPDEGNIVLIFSDKPLQLRQWLVTDAQGNVTSISLGNVETNLKLKPELFTFFDSDYE